MNYARASVALGALAFRYKMGCIDGIYISEIIHIHILASLIAIDDFPPFTRLFEEQGVNIVGFTIQHHTPYRDLQNVYQNSNTTLISHSQIVNPQSETSRSRQSCGTSSTSGPLLRSGPYRLA
jgi:hypothetical protein